MFLSLVLFVSAFLNSLCYNTWSLPWDPFYNGALSLSFRNFYETLLRLAILNRALIFLSAVSCRFGHIYSRNPLKNLHFCIARIRIRISCWRLGSDLFYSITVGGKSFFKKLCIILKYKNLSYIFQCYK